MVKSNLDTKWKRGGSEISYRVNDYECSQV